MQLSHSKGSAALAARRGSALPWEASASLYLPPHPFHHNTALQPHQVSASLLQGKPERGQEGISGGAVLPKHSSQGLVHVPKPSSQQILWW